MDLALLWEQVDTLRALEKAPILITDRIYATADDPKIADDHVCGPMCPFLFANDSGDFTCKKSGFCFGRQLATGCNEIGQAIIGCTQNAPVVRTPQSNVVNRLEVFSAACNIINKLVDARERLEVDATKSAKARKNAFRTASSEYKRLVAENRVIQWTTLLTLAASVFESTGGGVRRRVFTKDRRVDVACLLADIYQVLVIPYAKVDPKKPHKDYFCIALLYLLADGFGEISRVDQALLMATLPSEKLLKSMDINVSRVTASKRYIKDALHYMNQNPRRKRTREELCPVRNDEELPAADSPTVL
jgi:hypothetical protein